MSIGSVMSSYVLFVLVIKVCVVIITVMNSKDIWFSRNFVQHLKDFFYFKTVVIL